ncbi:MAG: sodium:alanine symporter family protein [Oscillospiraceae bacterium]|nr:sodium:alanine symporter family protein [Oscillospiraceae bacterium]
MVAFLEKVNHFVWGIPALILILGVGIYLSIRTGFAQITLFPKALRSFFGRLLHKTTNKDGVTSFQALCTALAATVGTGNIVGVAGAIAIGGPGAIFWMWICGIFGMVTKFAEAALAVRYQERNANGETVGGPMYMIRQGLPKRWHWMAVVYAFFGVVAAFGVGNATQVNAVIGSINSVVISFGGQESLTGNLILGILLAVLITVLLLGGAKKIGVVAEQLVPFAAVLYIILGIGVLWARRNGIGEAFASILAGAFSPRSVTGGMLGSAFTALRVGASRGVFTNEAGMGTASIAHGAASVSHPAEQGLMGIMEVFLDTIVICTMTALVILTSGVHIPYGTDAGGTLTAMAFSSVYGEWILIPIAMAMCCFAVATVLGWGLYGARCAQYLFGEDVWKKFVMIQAVTVVIGAVMNTGTVWLLSETVNGLMSVPNLITLAWLSPELVKLTRQYKENFPIRQNS